jgi:hypothetical protein
LPKATEKETVKKGRRKAVPQTKEIEKPSDQSKETLKQPAEEEIDGRSANDQPEKVTTPTNTPEPEDVAICDDGHETPKAIVESLPAAAGNVTKESEESWEDVQEEVQKPTTTKKKAPTCKTKKNLLRAISTPNRNESHLQSNVTFMDRSDADLSAIPVLSPPTVRKGKKKTAPPPVVNEASFQ